MARYAVLGMDDSPVGAYLLPQVVGGGGVAVTVDLEPRF